MRTPFFRRISIFLLVLSFLNWLFFFVPADASLYPLDGSFVKTLVQERGASRAEQKASFTIAIWQNAGSATGVVYPNQRNSFTVDGFRFDFYITNANTVTSTGVFVRTPDYDYRNPNSPATAALVWSLFTSFTSPTSGIGYNVRTANSWIEVTTAGTETRNGNIPQMISMNYGNLWTIAGVTALPARSEIVDFTPLNPRIGEVFSLSLSGQTYTATGTTVSEIISGILAAMVADPSLVGNCVDMTTKITCTSIDFSTSLSSLSSVTYPSPDTAAPIVTLVGSSTGIVLVGASYTELWATWIDNRDGTGTVSVPYSGSVNTAQPGDYVLSYRHMDTATNMSDTVMRTITVIDVTPPVVTVLGSGSITHELDLPYSDAGATWTDDVDGTGSVTASGISTMTSTWVYTLIYSMTDMGGNTGTGSREVTIIDTIAPVVTISTPAASVNANSYRIAGTAPGASQISISGWATSVFTSPVGGVFTAFIPLTQDTINTLIVTATDASGNIGTWSVLITETGSGNLFVSALSVSWATFSWATSFSGGSFSATTRVEVQTPVTFESANGARSVIPSGTIITSASGTVFDASSINALSVTVTGGLASNQTPNGALEFGTSGSGLHFSRPVMIRIPVIGFSGTTIPVKVKHGGTSTFVTTGLTNNPNATCTNGVPSSPSAVATVTGWLATIYTCAASTFVTYTETAVSSGGGGGGWSYTAPLLVSTSPTSTPLGMSSVSTGSLYTVVPVASTVPSKRGFSIEIVSTTGSGLTRITTLVVPTTFPDGSRVRVTFITDSKKKITLNLKVKNGTISWKTKRTGIYQITKIGK